MKSEVGMRKSEKQKVGGWEGEKVGDGVRIECRLRIGKERMDAYLM